MYNLSNKNTVQSLFMSVNIQPQFYIDVFVNDYFIQRNKVYVFQYIIISLPLVLYISTTLR
jgi:hypothetical protein